MRLQQLTNLPSLNSKIRSISGLFTVLLLSLIMVGCGGSSGGSSGGFTASPGGGGNAGGAVAGNGAVTFNFVRAQTPIVVPTATVSLRFRFYNALNGTGAIVLDQTQAFAATVTINNVPTTALSSVVTALDGNGFPIAQYTANFNVVANGTVTLGSTNGTVAAVALTSLTANPATLQLGSGGTTTIQTTANFGNGDSVVINGAPTTFASSDLNVASVNTAGLVTAILTGTANITATLTIGTTTRTAVVPVTVGSGTAPPATVTNLVVTNAQPVVIPLGAMSAPLVINATFSTGPTIQVGTAQGVTYTSTSPNISVNASDQIVLGAAAAAGETATIVASFGGRTVTILVQVSAATLTAINITPATASLPFGGFETQITVTGTFSDPTMPAMAINPTSLTYTGGTRFTVNAATGLLTTNAAGAAGTDTLTITTVNTPMVPLPILSGTAQITVGTAFVQALTVTAFSGTTQEPLPVTIVPGEIITYTVVAQLSDGTNALPSVDVTNFAALQVSSAMPANVLATGPRAIGLAALAAPGATLTFTLPTSGAGGAAVSATSQVIVVANQLVSAKYFFAGKEISGLATQLNLPRGYVGVFEVEGTFTNGNVRKLRADEYQVVDTGVGTFNGDAIRLFNDTFQITPLAGRFTDGRPQPNTTDSTGASVNAAGAANPIRDGIANAMGDGIDQVVDDLLINGAVRTTNPAVFGSNNAVVATRPTFRAVAADWRRGNNLAATNPGDFAPTGAGFDARNGFDQYTININNALEPTADQFSFVVTVTCTNPVGTVTVDSATFANYPTDANVVAGTVRELDVRVSFPASLPPAPASGITNFKLAEANVRFQVDNANVAGPDLNQFHHRPTDLGYIAVTRNVPIDVSNVNITASPLAGVAQQPLQTAAGIYIPGAVGPPATAPMWTDATYTNRTEVFGPTGATSSAESGGTGTFDPGPGGGAEDTDPSSPLQPNKAATAPDDVLTVGFTQFNNGGAGYQVTQPILFTLDPGVNGTAVPIAVGGTQVFRTLVKFGAVLATFDRSLDYPPRLNLNPTRTIGEANLATGNLTVAGTVAGAGDTVTATDAAGNAIVPFGTFTDSASMVTGNASATAPINVTP